MSKKTDEHQQDALAQVIERCRADQSVRRPNSEWCHKLFSLALAEQNQRAWEAICNEFHSMVEGWVKRYSSFYQTGEEALFFVNGAFSRLWQYASPLARDGKFQKLSDYLQYLKRCVWTSIEDHLRTLSKDALWREVALDEDVGLDFASASGSTERDLIVDQVLQVLEEITQGNERERLVAEETWVYGASPRVIQANYPHHFAVVGEVNQIKRNILRRLQRHPKLKTWLDE
jgi:hypothetical protein